MRDIIQQGVSVFHNNTGRFTKAETRPNAFIPFVVGENDSYYHCLWISIYVRMDCRYVRTHFRLVHYTTEISTASAKKYAKKEVMAETFLVTLNQPYRKQGNR